MADQIAAKLSVTSKGVNLYHSGIWANFETAHDGDGCPARVELRDEGPWGAGERRKTLLICEDDRNQILMARAVLESNGIEVLAAHNAEDAWNLFLHHVVDIVVTDVVLPDQDGFALMDKVLKCGDRHQRVPVITISGKPAPAHYYHQVEKAGGVMHLPKPVNWQAFAQFIKRICDTSHNPSAMKTRLTQEPRGRVGHPRLGPAA